MLIKIPLKEGTTLFPQAAEKLNKLQVYTSPEGGCKISVDVAEACVGSKSQHFIPPSPSQEMGTTSKVPTYATSTSLRQ